MLTQYPVSLNGRPDMRYTVTKEAYGHLGQRFVARFNGEEIAYSAFYTAAVGMAVGHANVARGCTVITAVEG